MDRLADLYIQLITGKIQGFIAFPDGELTVLKGLGRKISIYSGSFNPLHDAHKAIFDGIKGEKYYELSVARRDKAFLEFIDLNIRLKQFKWYAPIIVTNASKFVDKLKIFGKKKVIFHIGVDTAKRMIEDHSTKWIQALPTTFMVYDRIIDGVLRGLRNIKNKPNNFIEGIAQNQKYLHISSTELRKTK